MFIANISVIGILIYLLIGTPLILTVKLSAWNNISTYQTVASFLSAMGMKAHELIHDLVAPDTPAF